MTVVNVTLSHQLMLNISKYCYHQKIELVVLKLFNHELVFLYEIKSNMKEKKNWTDRDSNAVPSAH